MENQIDIQQDQLMAIHNSAIELANDHHLAKETTDAVHTYFNGVAHGSLLEGLVKDIWIYLHRRDRLSLLGTSLSLQYLIHQLETIGRLKPELHGTFRSRAKRVRSYNDYYGTRMEINTAAVLAGKGMDFSKQERPDFVTHGYFEGAGIECTSVHYDREEGGIITPKIIGAIRSKSKKPYSSRFVAANIDITNVIHNGVYYMKMPTQEELFDAIAEETERSNLGAVVIQQNIVDIDERSIRGVYKTFRNTRISDTLDAMILTVFPAGTVTAEDISTTPLVP